MDNPNLSIIDTPRPFALPARTRDDHEWAAAERVFEERNRTARRLRDQTALGLSLIAAIYLRERHRWPDFLAERGVLAAQYGPAPSSRFHSVCRHFLGIGVGGDLTGYASRLATVLDAWLASGFAPDEIPEWIKENGGIGRLSKPQSLASPSLLTMPPRADHQHYCGIDRSATSVEYYTPEYIFDAIGCRFDLDPASPGAQIVPWVPARQHFTRNGLDRKWHGFVWLNPPYGKELPAWLNKFGEHGNGIVLVVDRTSTVWWQKLASWADLILFGNRKISFVNTASLDGQSAMGYCLIAIGQQGVKGLETATRNGLGLLMRPTDPVEPATSGKIR